MKFGALIAAFATAGYAVAAASDQLRIGVLRKSPDCSVRARKGDAVDMHYEGRLADGEVFDSSYKRGQPFHLQVGVGMVIEGWDKGVMGMCLGEKRRLRIPPQLGYGERGAGPIPPNSELIFDVELMAVNDIEKSEL